jgi:hypothetical protein
MAPTPDLTGFFNDSSPETFHRVLKKDCQSTKH